MSVLKRTNDMGMRVADRLLSLPKDYEVLEAQWDRFYRAAEGHHDWATKAITCQNFLEGLQWTEEELNKLQDEGRPIVTLNRLKPLVFLLLGYQRQNSHDIRYIPGFDGSGKQDKADLLTALVKQAREVNQGKWNSAQVFQDGVITGRGYFDTRLDFEKNYLGEICEAVEDPFSIFIDPEGESYDPNEMSRGWGFFTKSRWLSPLDIYLLFGEKGFNALGDQPAGIPIDSTGYESWLTEDMSPSRFFGLDISSMDRYTNTYHVQGDYLHHTNRNRKLVRVLDCQHRQLSKTRYFLNLTTGNETLIPDTYSEDKIRNAMEYINYTGLPITVRTGLRKRIRWTITAGDRILHDDWSPYQRYTIVPYFAYFRRGKTMGMVEDLISPQQEINKRRSAQLHILMTTANSGWMYEKGTLDDDMKRALEEFGATPGINIEYREGYAAPQKIQPSSSPAALRNSEADATVDLKEIAGVNDSALGNLDRAQSGVAVQSRQKQALVGNEVYFDNFSRSHELLGCQYRDIIKGYYTEERIFEVRKPDGSSEQKMINFRDAAGELVNNMTQGSFEVAVDESPMSATFNQAVFDEAISLRKDLGIPIPDDIVVDMSTLPRKDEIKARLSQDRMIAENKAAIENLSLRTQSGLPMDQPLPPIVTSPDGATMASDAPAAMPAPAVPMQPQPVPPTGLQLPQ